ncbi:pharyngeal muscle protein 2-like [Eurosta solidaginis]|uniref:pharyngeal muscle protein 2-like n=1 Tax=Eurosta solidaginis TaxID=178769 RepID=UPI00353109DB
MAKLSEFMIQQLKRELEARGLNTAGNKVKLQARLRDAMESEGVNVDDDVFHPDGDETTTKIEEKNETSQAVTSTDLNVILAAISAQMSTVTSKMETQLEEQKTYMASQLEGQKTYMTSQLAEQLKAQETRISSQLEAQEIRVTSKLEAQDTKIVQLEDKIDAEIEALRGRIQELQMNRPAVSANLSIKSDREEPGEIIGNHAISAATENSNRRIRATTTTFQAKKELPPRHDLQILQVSGVNPGAPSKNGKRAQSATRKGHILTWLSENLPHRQWEAVRRKSVSTVPE